MPIPDPKRASLSGYVQPGKLLPWTWVDARMSVARNYWITTHAKGHPSSRPVWGIWRSPVLWFSTGSAIGRHLARDNRLQVNLESADEVVIVEGNAEPFDAADVADWVDAYREKYHWDMPAETGGVWRVRPVRVMAWLCDSSGLDGGAGFANSATEWHF